MFYQIIEDRNHTSLKFGIGIIESTRQDPIGTYAKRVHKDSLLLILRSNKDPNVAKYPPKKSLRHVQLTFLAFGIIKEEKNYISGGDIQLPMITTNLPPELKSNRY